MNTRPVIVLALACAGAAVACKSAPASPFNQLKDSQITVYRLQNYEPPAAAATPAPAPTPGAQPGTPMIPGLPPEISSWVGQATGQGLGSLIPPGLLPPGLIPGQTPPAAAPPPAAPPVAPDAPRFEGFRILGQSQVLDPKLREQLVDILGYPESFGTKKSNCLYAEMGVSFQQMPAPADVLVSFSCNKAEARNFTWPHTENGLTEDTVKKFSAITQKLFGGT
jgi:hypothetical protein